MFPGSGSHTKSLKQRLFGPSKFDIAKQNAREERNLLLEVLRGEREANREALKAQALTQAKLLESVAASSNVFAEYLKLFTHQGTPQVRIMNDDVEVELERSRQRLKESKEKFGATFPELRLPSPPSPLNPLDLHTMFDAMKEELL